MADIFWLMRVESEQIEDLTEYNRVPLRDLVANEKKLERVQPGQLLVARFSKKLDHERAGAIKFYRIEDVADGRVVSLEEIN